jgi:hypothetical protein
MEASFADLVDHELADRHTERDAAAAVAPTQNLLSLIKPANDLTLEKANVGTLAVAALGDWRTSVKVAVDTLTGVEHDLSTQSKVDEAKSLRHRLIGKPLAGLRADGKRIRSLLSQAGKAVTKAEEDAEKGFAQAEALITPQIEAAEAKLEAERQERARIEAERVAKHKAGLEKLQGYLGKAAGSTSATIEKAIEALSDMVFEKKDWEEFAGQAQGARDATVVGLQALLVETKAREDREAAAEALRLENERQAKALAAERAELERERKALAAERAAAQEAKKASDLAAAPQPSLIPEKALEHPVSAVPAALTKVKRVPIQKTDEGPFAEIRAAADKHGVNTNDGRWTFDLQGLLALLTDVKVTHS